ncbi:type I methionyl aminopeptidase [Actinomyces vulturis]|uniref:type I methionyl aminopeptidase n=1 Tax=Actinomyces vulturis TaxID=1857645 RepID=UPI0008300407|nr:type I methionyl aminopeptidase [Actinomyces vulturis]
MFGRNSVEIKTPAQVRTMRKAGLVVADIHHELRENVRAGVTPRELDQICREVIAKHNARSNFLGYYGYPASVCISVNDVVVHGIPGDEPLDDGDLVSFDCGAYLTANGKQWHGDACFTAIVGGEYRNDADRILDQATYKSLWDAIAELARLGQNQWSDKNARVNIIGKTVEESIDQSSRKHGVPLSIATEYGGHGIGTAMHMSPDVVNYDSSTRGPKLQPGMVLAIEPIIIGGPKEETWTWDDDWTVQTTDGSRAVHWEHTVALTRSGVWVLTSPDGGAKELAPYGLVPVEA